MPTFQLPCLPYDWLSPRAQPDSAVKRTLERLQQPPGGGGGDLTLRFLRLTSTTTTNVPKSTTFVLSEGVIDSSACFSSNHGTTKPVRQITPNGWRVATVISTSGGAAAAAAAAVVVVWRRTAQSAFEDLLLSNPPHHAAIFKQLGRDVLLAVHLERVQTMLWSGWQELKRGLLSSSSSGGELVASSCEAMEQAQEAEEEEEEPTRKRQRASLPTNELASALQSLSSSSSTSPRHLSYMLHLLEMREEVDVHQFVRFLQLVEESAAAFWHALSRNKLWNHWLRTILRWSTERIEFRAAVFVFSRASEEFPSLAELTAVRSIDHFRHRLTQLPAAAAVLGDLSCRLK